MKPNISILFMFLALVIASIAVCACSSWVPPASAQVIVGPTAPPFPTPNPLFSPGVIPTFTPPPPTNPPLGPPGLSAVPNPIQFSGATAPPQTVHLSDPFFVPGTFTITQVPTGVASAPASITGTTSFSVAPVSAGTTKFTISDGTRTSVLNIGVATPAPTPTPIPTFLPTATPSPGPMTVAPNPLAFSNPAAASVTETITDPGYVGTTYNIVQSPVGIASAPANVTGNTFNVKPIAAGTAVFNVRDTTGRNVNLNIGVTATPKPSPSPSPSPTPSPPPTSSPITIVQTGTPAIAVYASSPGTLACTLNSAPSSGNIVAIVFENDNGLNGNDAATDNTAPTGFNTVVTTTGDTATPSVGGLQAGIVWATGQTATSYTMGFIGVPAFSASCVAFEIAGANTTNPINAVASNAQVMQTAGGKLLGPNITPTVTGLTFTGFAWNDNADAGGDIAAGTQPAGWTEQFLYNSTPYHASLEGQFISAPTVNVSTMGSVTSTTVSFNTPNPTIMGFSWSIAPASVGPSPTPSPPPTNPPTPNPTSIPTNGADWPVTTGVVNFSASAVWSSPVPVSPALASDSANLIAAQFQGNNNNNNGNMRNSPAGTNDEAHNVYFAKVTDPSVNIVCNNAVFCPTSTANGKIPSPMYIPALARFPNSTYDGHMAVVQPSGVEYDFDCYGNAPSGDSCNAGTGANRNWVTGNTFGTGSPQPYGIVCGNFLTGNGMQQFGTSDYDTTSGGSCMSAGLLHPNELNGPSGQGGDIHHALALITSCTNGTGVAPFQNKGSGGSNCTGIGPALGYRLWYDVSCATTNANAGLHAWEKEILCALNQYGGYVTDDGDVTGDGGNGGSFTAHGFFIIQWGGTAPWAFSTPDQWAQLGSTNSWLATSPAAPGDLQTRWSGSDNQGATWNPSGVNWLTHMHYLSPCVTTQSC